MVEFVVCATSTVGEIVNCQLNNCQLFVEALGPLVPLGFAITGFTPAAYQRHSL